MIRSTPRRGTGFTLLEVLIALAVFAVTSAALIGATTRNVSQSALLRDKTIAHWIAENELNRVRLGEVRQAGAPAPDDRRPAIGTRRSQAHMADRDWEVQLEVRATENKDIHRITVSVFRDRADTSDQPLVELVGFIGRY